MPFLLPSPSLLIKLPIVMVVQTFATVIMWCHTSPLFYQSVVVQNLCDYVCRVHPRRRIPQGDTRWDDETKVVITIMTAKALSMQAWILQSIYQDFLALGKGLYCAPFILFANYIQICAIFILVGNKRILQSQGCYCACATCMYVASIHLDLH